ncbi:unnamed protein product [Bemisia tabaci]|uniref:Uncharacterized protein n=1 Tax=Bemisia tabaci TaxID=7038 RepID=A0A9P0F325_BEMTA|nr:PREDICTED: protein zyg-11 homolog B-like [Bemisia tabaci]CAH0387590.1 unnamed protein product [Bemisia tabaci]
MYVTPKPLQEECINFICNHFQTLWDPSPGCQENPSESGSIHLPPYSTTYPLHWRDEDVSLPKEVSEVLLRNLSTRGRINDTTITIFDPRSTALRNVCVADGSKLSKKGLEFLRNHKVESLEISKLKLKAFSDLLECLGEWSIENLKSLNVSGGEFQFMPNCIDILLELDNLRIVNVSNTRLCSYSLDFFTRYLQHLEVLNISSTEVDDLSPLKRCRNTLKGLFMYQLEISNQVDVILDLEKLQMLDISTDPPKQLSSNMPLSQKSCDITSILSNPNALPDLISLDISGKNYDGQVLLSFVQNHPRLKFLGLVCSKTCHETFLTEPKDQNFNPDLMVTGTGSEDQIFLGLTCPAYKDRSLYVQKLLKVLFKLSLTYVEARVDIVELVLEGMKRHPDDITVQLAGTACLYNLTKGELSQKIHPDTLREVAATCLDAMQRYPSHYQLQKNTLLTICSEKILQAMKPEKYRCAKLVLDCLCSFDDPSMNKMSVAICSILASKLATHETSLLGSNTKYMKKMLFIAAEKIESKRTDVTLRFTLSALWNLTDESPDTCKVFLNEKGLCLFQLALDQFMNESSIETKILGLVNNIAEVKELRKHLLKPKLILKLRSLLHSSHIDVSYFSAGIIANLACEGEESWLVKEISRSELLSELETVIHQWKQPEMEMVAYRSFKPLIPLLECPDSPVQLWAVWAINHVCTKNVSRYCPMLKVEKVSLLLNAIYFNPNVEPRVQKIVSQIIDYINACPNEPSPAMDEP